jgi:phosphoenolpyruvate-protein kinase (PTS system EI component)
MYPMIVDLDQFLELKAVVEDSIKDIPKRQIRHGVMFEVPSACLDAKEILEKADFGSIGTNDLIQYLFAIDRNNEFVAYDYKPGRPVLWRLIRTIAEAAKATGKPLSICGEIAGDPEYIAQIASLGIDTVSVSSKLITNIRNAVTRSAGKEKVK